MLNFVCDKKEAEQDLKINSWSQKWCEIFITIQKRCKIILIHKKMQTNIQNYKSRITFQFFLSQRLKRFTFFIIWFSHFLIYILMVSFLSFHTILFSCCWNDRVNENRRWLCGNFIYFISYSLHIILHFRLKFSFNCMRAFVKETHSNVNDLYECPQKESMDKTQKIFFLSKCNLIYGF